MNKSELFKTLKGELLEISIADEYEELVFSDSVKKVNGVIFGYLKDVVEDILILDSFMINEDHKLVSGNTIYINTWYVKVFTKLNEKGTLGDIFLSSAHSRRIKEMLGI